MEEKKFNAIYIEYAKNIFRYIFLKVSDYDEAADLTADTFTKFWKKVKKEPVTNAKAFLFVIASSVIIDFYRKKKKQKKVSLSIMDESFLGIIDKSENQFENQQEVKFILEKVKKLRKNYQDVLLLYYVEELTIREISLIFHKTENNTRVVLHRAVQALRKLL